MNSISLELIKKLPKVELHCYLDGSLRINTIIDISKKIKLLSNKLENDFGITSSYI